MANYFQYENSAPEDAPILHRRGSENFRRLRRQEYAFVAHRFPYVEDLEKAAAYPVTRQEALTIIDMLAEEYGLPRVVVKWQDRGTRSNASAFFNRIRFRAAAPDERVEGKRNGTENRYLGQYLDLHTVLHEFAHLIGGGDERPGHKGEAFSKDYERYDYRTGRWSYVPGRYVPKKNFHGPSFVLAMTEVFDVMRGVTDAY